MNLALEVDKETVQEVLAQSTNVVDLEDAKQGLDRMRIFMRDEEPFKAAVTATVRLIALAATLPKDKDMAEVVEVAVAAIFGTGVDLGLRIAQRYLEKQGEDAPEPSDTESQLGQTNI